MRLRTRKRQVPGDSGAMSDLAFLLIIYFMVIAGFQLNQGFLLGLPERGSTTWIQQDDLAVVQMDHRGTLWLRGEAHTSEQLGRMIGSAVARRPNLTVQLQISPEAEYQHVVDFIALMHRLQVDNFSFRLQEQG
ncbi:ExbD/TolR family protein [Spirochaeta africana]|uniref:Biopolymer transport protein n=1 Tax=Spirochaeta africana (strain ATCC 700263 / DSM 8902 / Z-7692) TaxID=889378 RepID=H9ULH8_SPIAZ|nr:biopolymer transporter ExbD [Spirochaeta africana]AFG38371.1 biopolymer transport protein [Spirochaeta africana DSM 8902]